MFSEKLNKRDISYVIQDEKIFLDNGVGATYLNHDNVTIKSLEIWTEANKSGEKVLNYTTEIPKEAPWSIFIKVYSSNEKNYVYATYETAGDQVEAKDINDLQNAVVDISNKLKGHEGDLKCHIENKEIDGGNFV